MQSETSRYEISNFEKKSKFTIKKSEIINTKIKSTIKFTLSNHQQEIF